MKEIDIQAIAEQAAENALTRRTTGGYFKDNYTYMNEDAKEILAKVYLMRRESMENPEWVDIYADWLNKTNFKWQEGGINKMQALAKFYFESVKKGKGELIKKAAQKRVEEFTYGINR